MAARGNANDLLEIPPDFWRREAVIAALSDRDMGRLFSLVRQYCGASQTRIGMACGGFSQGRVSDIMSGAARIEAFALFEQIADGLRMPDPSRVRLGLAPLGPIQDLDTEPGLPDRTGHDFLALGSDPEEDDVRRRSFVSLAGIALAGTAAGETAAGMRSLADVFSGIAAPQAQTAPGIAVLAARTRAARADYQACRYGKLLDGMPGLLGQLSAAIGALDGDDRLAACALAADAEQVAAGLMLKLGDQPLAALAADRAMRAAAASCDPVAVAAAARSVTHALLDSGHKAAAVDVATAHAGKLERATGLRTPEQIATHGATVLRGAVAAARDDDRGRAYELLRTAEESAARLGPRDGNVRGTAFGATNVRLHEVNIAVTLGDAGAALQTARTISPASVTVTERRACFYIDVGRAWYGRGHYEQAYLALRAADETAPEEVKRAAVRQLADDIAAVAPPALRGRAREFAARIST